RLGLMLRDRLGDRTSARLALDRARALDPLNLDVVRELSGLLESLARGQMLAATAHNFRDAIVHQPSRSEFYEKLAPINAWQAARASRALSPQKTRSCAWGPTWPLPRPRTTGSCSAVRLRRSPKGSRRSWTCVKASSHGRLPPRSEPSTRSCRRRWSSSSPAR